MQRASRRQFVQGGLILGSVGLLGGCGLLPAPAQQPAAVHRLGYLSGRASALEAANLEALRRGMRDLGYVEGRDFTLETRFAEGRVDQFPELAAQLVRLPVDLIFTVGPQATAAARQATATIPVVFVRVADPVGPGFVAGLAHPGGNVTGFATLGIGLSQKRLELLKAAFPAVARLAVLWNPSNPAHEPALRELEAAARTLRVELRSLPVREPNDYDAAFQQASGEGVDGLMPLVGDFLLNTNAGRLVEFAATRRLPAIYPLREYIDAGGLMTYMPDEAANFRRAAIYVDKILKGASPADLPVEQPTNFEFVVNLKTAQALGLTIPQSVLQQATEVVQ